MPDTSLSQIEADALLALEKHSADDVVHEYPGLGGAVRIPLCSPDRRETFSLDIRRSRVVLTKGTYQTRARGVVILARLDFDGQPHRNPDGEEISCPHLHLYREGYGDKWAIPIPSSVFHDQTNRWELLVDFMRYCNITQLPDIRQGLFT